ncbi:MAG: DUF3137 domain-containing protein [Oscillospiraceae bacterium]|jgi:hypothetical protein|nr:DUF3137 domain-containing protein [Oscillospiraceae bacterium]
MENSSTVPAGGDSDARLAARIGKLQAVYRALGIVSLISLAVFVLSLVSAFVFQIETNSRQAILVAIIAIASIAITIAAAVAGRSVSVKIKKLTSGDFIRGILRETFQDCQYHYNVGVAGWRVEESRLVADWNEISGGDHVEGIYKGHAVEFSDINLKYAYDTTNSDGSHTTRSDTVFKGQWIVCELGRELAQGVYVWENEPSSLSEVPPGWLASNGYIETDNPAFNNRFTVESSDPTAPSRVLAPHFMDYLLRTAVVQARRYIYFQGKHVQFALDNGLDMFEVNGNVRSPDDIDALRANVRDEIKNITEILDQIMLNEYLFPAAMPHNPEEIQHI